MHPVGLEAKSGFLLLVPIKDVTSLGQRDSGLDGLIAAVERPAHAPYHRADPPK